MDETITLAKACKLSKMTRRGLLLNAEKGKFSAYKNNQGHWRIYLDSFNRWLNERPSPADAATTNTDSNTDTTITELRIANSALQANLDATIERAERAEALVEKLIKPWWRRF